VTLIVWSKDGEVVDTEQSDGGRSTDSRGALVLESVTINDEGLYYCSAYSPLDHLRTDYPIWVSVKGMPRTYVGHLTKTFSELFVQLHFTAPCYKQWSGDAVA